MEHILYIGPEYKNHRGGIGALLETYSRNIRPFKFISTYVTKSIFHKAATYIAAIFKLIYLLITDPKIRILHIHCASKGSFLRKSLVLLIAKLFGKKVVLHIHGGGFHNFYENFRSLRWYIRFILERTDALVCLSEMWKTYYSTTFKLKRVEIINNVIEKPVAGLEPVSHNGQVNFLFLGLISDKKGVFDLLDVMVANKENFKNRMTVTVAGNGETERLEQTIVQNHPGGEVNYAGWVNGAKKAELLNSCDVYILPSYNEGLPISILEAMAYGKPVIATEVGGVPEIVKPGYNGWLFKPGDHAAIKDIISEVLDNKNLLKEYGKNSLDLSKKYTPEAMMDSLNSLYKKVINE